MSRREDTAAVIYCDLTEDELYVVGQMRMRGGYTSDANLIRSALWSLADEWGDIEIPNGVFDQRTPGRPKKADDTQPSLFAPDDVTPEEPS